MKYIVRLKKVIERTVVVDATTNEEADKKLLNGEIEASFEKVGSHDVYGGFDYIDCETVGEGDELILNIKDFAKAFGTEVELLERYFFKYTNCGMPISWDNEGVTLVGYAEGADCDGPSEKLRYPFLLSEAKAVIDRLEDEADEMWHEWNGKEDEDELPEE